MVKFSIYLNRRVFVMMIIYNLKDLSDIFTGPSSAIVGYIYSTSVVGNLFHELTGTAHFGSRRTSIQDHLLTRSALNFALSK